MATLFKNSSVAIIHSIRRLKNHDIFVLIDNILPIVNNLKQHKIKSNDELVHTFFCARKDYNMKKFTKILAVVALLSGVFGVALTQKETVQAEAKTAQTDRRIYAWTKEAWAYNGDVYIHYWGGAANNFNAADKMTLVVNDHWNGLYYFDVPSAATSFLLKNAYTGDGTIKTADINISDIFTGTDYKAVETWGGGASVYYQTTVALPNNGQVQAVLSAINSCSTSYAGGYNAWPQLDDLFITPNEGKTDFASTTLNEPTPYGGIQPNIGEKISYLEAKYTVDQASSARLFIEPTNKNTLAVVTIGVISVTSIAGYYFLKTKKLI